MGSGWFIWRVRNKETVACCLTLILLAATSCTGVYNLHWKAEKSLLLYPRTNQDDRPYGTFHYDNLGKKCKIAFLSITDGRAVKQSKLVANEIFKKL